MRWDAVAAPDLKQDLILFDGDCVLCSHWARFVHERDTAHHFKFTAIQSPFGRALAERFGVSPDDPETNIAIIAGRALFKSDVGLGVLRTLPGWRWTYAAAIAPKSLRDWFYDRIARNRYHWFGKRSQCWAGDPDFTARIL